MSSRPRSLFKDFNDRVQAKVDSYLYSILSLVRSGPDRSKVALILWQQVALPSILYGCEVIPLTLQTISKIETAQNAVGKFVLQIPTSSANVAVHVDCGLLPVKYLVCERVLQYSSSLLQKPLDYWPSMAFYLSVKSHNRFYKYYLTQLRLLPSFPFLPSNVRLAVRAAARVSVATSLSQSKTTFAIR